MSAPTKRGRPRRVPEEKTVPVLVRYTLSEKQRLKVKAKIARSSLSGYIRDRSLSDDED